MLLDDQHLLRLLHLADSALPIGATAHSFGLETLVAEGVLSVDELEAFLHTYMDEAGGLESAFCRFAYRLTALPDISGFAAEWLAVNARLSAFKTARESRAASATLGRRLLQLALGLGEQSTLETALLAVKDAGVETHYSAVFGLIGGVLGVDERAVVLAFLRQLLAGLVSCCQRLMPLGQSQAGQILWRFQPALITIAGRGEAATLTPDTIAFYTPLPDLGSMRHPHLATRLFIS